MIANNDELKRELAQKGIKRSQLFSWDESAEKVWEILINVAKK